MKNTPINFNNKIQIPIQVFDAFIETNTKKTLENYFGTLTQIGGNIATNGTARITPTHSPFSTYIVYDTAGNPVKRVVEDEFQPTANFDIIQADLDVISATKNFMNLLIKSPKDPLAISFQQLIKDGKANASKINVFFQATTDYNTCTFVSYVLVSIQQAETSASVSKPLPQKTYSLQALLVSFGVDYPSELPDIVITNFSCCDNNDTFSLACDIDLKELPFADGILDNILSFLPDSQLHTKIIFNYNIGLSFLNTTLECTLPNISIPSLNGIQIDQPTIIINIAPLFKFVTFEIKAEMPFSILGTKLDADIAMTMDNAEAEVGIVLKGDNTSLPTLPVIKGVHFDSIGLGLGVFFEPPGYAFGVQGKFHVGDNNNIIALDDDTFALVCQFDGDVPNPIYLSFYIPKLDINELITVFTDTTENIDIPLSFFDISFTWAENIMEPITLPDGSVVAMQLGFSAYMDLLGLTFFGDIGIAKRGGTLTMSPLHLGPISVTGDGKNIFMKFDAQGNPIKNNFIPKTATEKTALANATSKEIIQAGGPEMSLSLSQSPYFSLDAAFSFLDIVQAKIDVQISKNGIGFELDFGSILTEKMTCNLNIGDNKGFNGKCSFGINLDIPLPHNLGTIPLVNCSLDAEISVIDNNPDIGFTVSAGFDFDGIRRRVGPFSVDVNISKIEDVISAIKNEILKEADNIFNDLTKDALAWILDIENGVIKPLEEGAEYIAKTLKETYDLESDLTTTILKGLNYGVEDIAKALKNVFNKLAPDVATILQQANYAIEDIAKGIHAAFETIASDIANILHTLGYAIGEIATALKNGLQLGAAELAKALTDAGYWASDIANCLVSLFNSTAQEVANFLHSAGCLMTLIGKALSDCFKMVEKDLINILKDLGATLEDFAHVLSGVFQRSYNYIVTFLQNLGHSVEEIAKTLASVFDMAANDVANVLKDVGYGIDDITNVLKNVFNQASDVAAQILYDLGFSKSDLISVLLSIFGLSMSSILSILDELD